MDTSSSLDFPEPAPLSDSLDHDITISSQLAERCIVGQGLADIEDDDMHCPPGDVRPAATGPRRVPGVPGCVHPAGLAVLDAWAAAAADTTRPTTDWLPAFILLHAPHMPVAAQAADFLGCGEFQAVWQQVQLLRVARLAGRQLEGLAEGARAGEPLTLPPQAQRPGPVTEAELVSLPCMRPASPEPAAQQPQGAAPGQEGPQQPPAGPAAPPAPKRLGPARFDALVAALVDSGLLACTGPEAGGVRRTLIALGVTPSLRAGPLQRDESVTEGGRVFLGLPLPRLPGYKLARVTVEATAHDQGWSDYPEDHGTHRGSWTWGELVLLRGGDRVSDDDPGRLYTNLHASRDWQRHTATVGPEARAVREANELLYGGANGGTGGGEGEDEPYELALRVCAAFPGWRHFIREATITVDLCAREA